MDKLPHLNLASWIPKYKKFMESWHLRTVLRRVLPTLIVNYDHSIQLHLDCSGENWTDGKVIHLSLLHSFFDEKYSQKEWMIAMRALQAHECQHVNSTPMHYMKEIRDWYGDYMESEHGIAKSLASKLAGDFFNIFEDGRIEQIAATHHPGLRIPLQYLNIEMFKDVKLAKTDLDGGEKEFNAFRLLTLCYAKLGVGCQGAKNLAGSELDDYFKKIYPLLDTAVNGYTCADCYIATQESLTILAPYFAKLLKASSDLVKNIEKMADHMSGSEEESEFNDGDPSGGVRIGKGGKGTKSDPKATSKDKGKGDDEGDAPGKSRKKGKAGKDGSGPGKDGSTAKAEGISPAGPMTPSGRCMDEDTTSGPGAYSDELVVDELDVTKLPYSVEELAEAIEKSAAGAAPTAPPKSAAPELNKLTSKEEAELAAFYAGDDYARFKEEFTISDPIPLPPETQSKARILHRKLSLILKQKCMEQRNQRKGVLDTRALWKVGSGEKNIMMKRGKPVSADCAVFELVDNSGSMGGNKFKLARLVAGAIEVALHDLAALKISLFCTRSTTRHDTIKDFGTVGTPGKSIAFGSITDAKITAGGGNKDGYSIRVATKELLKRPEKKKVLVVVSDGEPTDYRGGTVQGREDVRKAVAEAKKKGIIVIALLIGDRSYINSFKDRHVEMYGKSLIACEPTQMLAEFEKLFTKLIKAS